MNASLSQTVERVPAFLGAMPLAFDSGTCSRLVASRPPRVLVGRAHRQRMATTQGVGDVEPEESDDDRAKSVESQDIGGSSQPLRFDGDGIPFSVKIISPPPKYLGTFRLNPRTGCNDIIKHEECAYVVKRVRQHYHYDFDQKGFYMYKKTIEIKSLARKSLDQYLDETLRES
jgi:hypothetical protein